MQKQGFSLLELSIVLVIIGLLAGGIVGGQSLVKAAELRSVIKEFEGFNTAYNGFRSKYNAIPGDMRNATRFWGRMNGNADCVTNSAAAVSTQGACDGNGTGTLQDAAAANGSSESFQFWRQLQLAGLIEGTYSGLSGPGSSLDAEIETNVPRSKVNSAGWNTRYMGSITVTTAYYYPANYGHALYFGSETGAAETMLPVLKSEEAWNIDTKLDDGRANTGKILSQPHTTSYAPSCTSAATSDNYNLTNSGNVCALTFVSGW